MRSRQQKVLNLLDTSGVRLHALLAKLTRSEDAAGELTQELFLRLSGSRTFGRADDTFAYAWRAAVNLACAWRRSRKATTVTLNENHLPAQAAPSVLDNMICDEEFQRVLDAISHLKEPARSVVVMRYVEQESYDSIARRLGKKPQHARSLCAKALAKLRARLADGQSRPAVKR